MAYNQSPNLPHGWVNSNAPPPINTGGGYPPSNQPQLYQAPQFTPPPVSPDKNGGNMLKTLNFFSKQPSYTPVSNAGTTTLASPVVGPSGGFFPPQGFGVAATGLASPQTTYNTNPIPSYTPAVGGPAGYQPVKPPEQQYPTVPLPGRYNTNQPLVAPGQQQQQQHQQHQHQYQHQHQLHQQQQQQHQQHQQQHQQQQPQQNYHQAPSLAHPQPQHFQTPQASNPTPFSGTPAPPPYAPSTTGYGAGPEKPTIQSLAASAAAHPPSASHSANQQNANTPTTSTTHPPANTPQDGSHNVSLNGPQSGQALQTNGAAPSSNSPSKLNNMEPDSQYWNALIENAKMPMGPNPTMRSMFRGIAACISKECTVDHSPPCVISPTRMSMYYATLLTYSDRQTKLFSKARTHPSVLTNLYNKLNCQHLLIPHPIGDGKRRPPLPALTIDGFEHWMLLQVLLNPDVEHQRLTAFLQSPNRVVIDSSTQRPIPVSSIPRSAFPAGPNEWAVKRYAGLLEQALNSTTGRAEETEEIPDVEGTRKELAYFRQKSTETQSETHKMQGELVGTRKELEWVKTKLTSVQSDDESSRKRLAEKEGEIEWLKKKLAETQAELESSRGEVEGLRRLDIARRGSVSSVSSMGTTYGAGAGSGALNTRLPYPIGGAGSPIGPAPGTPVQPQGGAYFRQQYRPSS